MMMGYIRLNSKDFGLVVSRKAKENGCLTFIDNIRYVVDEIKEQLIPGRPMSVRNEGFCYDLLLLRDDEAEEVVVLSFGEIYPRRKVDINFSEYLLGEIEKIKKRKSA